jgi:drug/metabolite transporter (DMT)-like permease
MPGATHNTHSPPSTRTFSCILLVIVSVLWSTCYAPSEPVLPAISVFFMLAAYTAMAAQIPLPIVYSRCLCVMCYYFFHFVLSALPDFVANRICQCCYLTLTSASDVIRLLKCSSIFTTVLSWIILRERSSKVALQALLPGSFEVHLIVERLIPELSNFKIITAITRE